MKSIKYVLVALLATTLSSCNLDMHFGQTNGNGNVVTEERHLNESFDKVKGSAGLDVYLTEGSENKVVVEADENLLDIIETNVINGKLTIRANKNIGRSKAKKVHVTYEKLVSIEASSGADVIGNSVIISETLNLDSSSGADLEVEVMSKNLYAETSSGADIVVSGKTMKFTAKASSGSDLKAKKLNAIDCNARASSGADITVNVKDRLDAKASSGGDVRYYGNPEAVSKEGGSSGSIRKM
jgi:hypothetical protein